MRTVMDKRMRVTKTIRIVTEGVKIKNKMYLQVKINRLLISREVTQMVPVKIQDLQILRAMGTRTVQGPVARPKPPVEKAKSTKEAIPMTRDSS